MNCAKRGFPDWQKRRENKGVLAALGGVCAFMVVMGIGRFAFTAVLPGMMAFHGFGEDVAGVMGGWNYAGYLAGVLLMRKEKPGQRRFNLFVVFLLMSLVTTAGMGIAKAWHLLHAIRFLAGFASGACFVLCSSIVLDTLAAINRPGLAGLLYSGVGAGIALGGLAAGPLEATGGSEAAWFGMAALCIPLVAVSVFALRPSHNYPQPAASGGASAAQGKVNSRYVLLLIAYFLEGFGYIIGATFLVVLVQNVTNSPEIAKASWIVTGCAAALSAPVWRVAARRGYLPMLMLAFVVQAAGALLPILSHSSVAALGAGLLLGGTFMGITVLSLQYGVLLSGRPSANTVAVMTALYGVGQIIGPIVAGGKGFYTAFVVSAVSLLAGAGLLLAASIIKREQ
jgi:predicted MFS family arabinose efflux permease